MRRCFKNSGFFHNSLIWACCLVRELISKRTKGLCFYCHTVKRLEFIPWSWVSSRCPFPFVSGILDEKRRTTRSEAVMALTVHGGGDTSLFLLLTIY